MSYILKTADTLSGARPGARVNLEEGYQIRLFSAIDQVVRSFPGILKIAIMNGGREVHIDVNHNKVKENQLENFTSAIAKKIEEEVAYLLAKSKYLLQEDLKQALWHSDLFKKFNIMISSI